MKFDDRRYFMNDEEHIEIYEDGYVTGMADIIHSLHNLLDLVVRNDWNDKEIKGIREAVLNVERKYWEIIKEIKEDKGDDDDE